MRLCVKSYDAIPKRRYQKPHGPVKFLILDLSYLDIFYILYKILKSFGFFNSDDDYCTRCGIVSQSLSRRVLFRTTLTRTIIAPSYGMPPGLKSSTTMRIFALEVQNNNAGCNLGFAHTQMHFILKRKVVFN